MQIKNPFAAKPAAAAVKLAEPASLAADATHVLVPVDLLRAIHDTLAGHAEAVRALLPVVDHEADIADRTAARLKRQ